MPTVTKVNPILRNVARSFNGKSVSHFTISPKNTGESPVDISGSRAPGGAIQSIFTKVIENATLVMAGAAGSTTLDVFVEGEFPGSDYGSAGTQTFAEFLEAQLQGLGEVDDIDLSGTTVALTATYNADRVEELYAS